MLFADIGVEDNGDDDDEEEVKDVAEEVEGCSSGGRDDNIAHQGIHWIVVQDEMDPENNDLWKWQCNVGSCRILYASKLRLRGHVMAIHAFEEVEAGLKAGLRKRVRSLAKISTTPRRLRGVGVEVGMAILLVKGSIGLWCGTRWIQKTMTSGNGNVMLDHVVLCV